MAETPSLPLKTKLLIAGATALTNASIRRDGTVNRRLFNFFDLKAPPNPTTPIDGVTSTDHTVDATLNLKVRLFTPSSSSSPSPLPVVVYFHGGGFCFHSAFTRSFATFCRRLARRIPAVVVSVDYRLAPENPHPAAYDDGLAVLRWLDENKTLLPDVDVSAVFIAGDSAGGNIAHHVARAALSSTSFSRLSVIGLVLLMPFFGGEEETESERRLEGTPFSSRERHVWMWRSFLPAGSGLDHEAANVFGPGSGAGEEDWGGFVPTMVVVGGRDALMDRQMMYYEGMRGAGVDVSLVEYPNAVHAFYVFPELPESGKVVEDVGEFVRKQLANNCLHN